MADGAHSTLYHGAAGDRWLRARNVRKREVAGGGERRWNSEPDPTAAPLIFILFHFRYCMSCVCNERGIKRSGGDERVGQKGWRARLIRLGRQDGGMLGWMYAGELRSTFHGCLHRRGSRCPMRNGLGWMAGRDNKAYRDDPAAVFFGDMIAKCFISFYF